MKKIRPSQVAKAFQVHRLTVYTWIDKGTLPEPRKTPGGQFFWLREDLEGIDGLEELLGDDNE